MANGIMDRLGGLLAGGNPLFDLGLGLLAASGPSATPRSIGQVVASGAQFASERQRAAMQNEMMRAQLLAQKRQQEAQEQLQGLLGQTTTVQAPGTQITSEDPLGINVNVPGRMDLVPTINTPQGQQRAMGLLGDIAPQAMAEGLLGKMLATQGPAEFQSPVGKLIGDLEIAESRGNQEAAGQIRAALEQELGDSTKLSEIRSFRNDVIRNSGEFVTAQQGFDRVRVGATSGTAAGDLALVFGFMKILDPQSVVREGEFALAETAAGVPAQVRALYNRLLTGERLTPEQRADFLSQAQAQFQERVKQQVKLVEDAKGFAERNSMPLADVVPGFVMPEPFEPIELDVAEPAARPQRTLRNPLTPQELDELNRLRRDLGLGGN